jgi:hypothetical protein
VYGQEAVLPVEVNLGSYRRAKWNNIDVETYCGLMMDNIDEMTGKRLEALEELEKDKKRVARAYNKKVKAKSFQVGDLVWKTILPIGTKNNKFSKWVSKLERPVQGCQSLLWKFLCGGNFAREAASKSSQKETLEEILSKCLARCLI